MSCDAYSKIVSSVILGLGRPEPELLSEAEVAEIIYGQLEYYLEGIRQSDQNLVTKRTAEFTVDSTFQKDLTALTSGDIAVPLWCERKVGDSWEFVETVNLDTLPQRAQQNYAAVAYIGDNPSQITAEFSYYNNDTFRIAYSPVNSFLTADVLGQFPTNLVRLIIVASKLEATFMLIMNALKYVDKRPELSARIKGWEILQQGLVADRQRWREWYDGYRKSSRGYHRAKNRTDILSDISPVPQRNFTINPALGDIDGGTP
jgi:hypothetical protein